MITHISSANIIIITQTTATAASNNLLQSPSSNLLGNDITNHHSEALNVNDFLITPDLNDQQTNKMDFDGNLLGDSSIVGDHNYTHSGDHNYTNLKRPCAFNSMNSTSATGTNSNTTSNKIKKVNS